MRFKRSDHAVTFDELQRLDKYREWLSKAHDSIHMLMICGGGLDVSLETKEQWDKRPDGDIVSWNSIYKRSRRYYQHYRAVLESDVESRDFFDSYQEVANTRKILDTGSVYRDPKSRAEGLGFQHAEYELDITPDNADEENG